MHNIAKAYYVVARCHNRLKSFANVNEQTLEMVLWEKIENIVIYDGLTLSL